MTFTPLSAAAEELSAWAASEAPRIRLGFPVIDKLTQGGPSPGEMVMILARSGVGKTTVGCNIARNLQGTPTVFFSLEMGARMLLLRMAAIHTDSPTFVIEQQLRYQHASKAVDLMVADFPMLSICDDPAMSIKGMAAYCAEAAEVWGTPPKVIIIDYLELVRAAFGVGEGLGSIDSTTRKLKDFAREHDCVVIVLHQLSMSAVKSKRPAGGVAGIDYGHLPVDRLDAKYGGDVAADYTLGIYRPALDPNLPPADKLALDSVIKVQFLKTRGGSEINYFGEEYHYNSESLRITTPPRLMKDNRLVQ